MGQLLTLGRQVVEGAQFSDGSAIPDGKVRRLTSRTVKAPHASALTALWLGCALS
jgi:hypothetical protein